ncbi:MAG: HAD family hydrolase [Bacteroidetes bacterium]|nr:HAD family hydrolase [Bacteroidota bacterium]
MNLHSMIIDRGWTLFLDRDGVINRRIENGYVRTPEEFEFLPGVKEALKILNPFFGRILVVSNQQGVGKGLMTEAELTRIHDKMLEEISYHGGRIDQIYFCPDREDEWSLYRKPGPGMALRARKDYPGIVFKKSIVAGDSLVDMLFGKRLGMFSVLIGPDNHLALRYPKCVDVHSPDLLAFATTFFSGNNKKF